MSPVTTKHPAPHRSTANHIRGVRKSDREVDLFFTCDCGFGKPSKGSPPKAVRPAYGRGAGVGRGLGVGEHLPVHGVGVGVGVGDAVGDGVGVGVDVAVAVGVGVGVGGGPDGAQYLPPVLKMLALFSPPQMIISLPVHTAVCKDLSAGASTVLVAVQLFVLGLYLPPVLK